jgi:hypothetical protein
MRAVAGILRECINAHAPTTNDGKDWTPPADYAEVSAAACHLDAAIEAHDKPVLGMGESQMLFIGGSTTSFRCDARDDHGQICRANVFKKIGELRYKCNACSSTYTGE